MRSRSSRASPIRRRVLFDRPMRYGAYAPENFDLGYRGHGDGAQGAADVAQSSRDRAARRRRPGDVSRPAAQRGRRDRAAEGYADRPRHRPRRAWDLAHRSRAALRRPRARRRGAAAVRAARRPAAGHRAERRVTDPVAAYYVADILRGAPPPANALNGRIAFKTGTSYGFRDALAIGFDRRTTIAVWVGRPDNGPTPGLIGREAAAPILFDAFERLGREHRVDPRAEGRASRATITADLPPPLAPPAPGRAEDIGRVRRRRRSRSRFPPDGARIDLGLKEGAPDHPLALKALGGAPPFTWFVNGAPVGEAEIAAPIGLEAGRRRLRPRVGDRRQGRVGRGDGAAGVNFRACPNALAF